MNARSLLLSAVLASAPLLAVGDIVHLHDGRTIEGTLKRDVNGWTVTDATGKTTVVQDSAVKSIQKTSNIPADVMAEAKVASIRRVVDNQADPKVAIDRYQKFIEQNKDQPKAVEIAAKELATWKERIEKKMVKVGNQWVTTEQRTELVGKGMEAVEAARTQIKQGNYKAADAALDQVLAADKTNASALYLKGVVAAKQEQLGVAKKNFELVREQMADHGPTLNNLGVILFQQKQWSPALAAYDQAMQAAPRNRAILDNVAEALNALSEDQRESTVGKRVVKRFMEQDAALQQQLEKDGLYRWGGTYIDKEKKAEIDKKQANVKERLNVMAKDYDRLEDRLRTIDRTINVNEERMETLSRNRGRVDPYGGSYVVPLPREYYEYKREIDRLKVEREGVAPKLDEFRAKAAQVKQDLPVPAFTGKQQIIETEGTPVALPAAPQAAPTGKPS